MRSGWALVVLAFAYCAHAAAAQNAVEAGELFVEPATLIAVGFEWRVQGDENRNADVKVEYRLKGAERWSLGLPFLRMHGERTETNLVGDDPSDYVVAPHNAWGFTYVAPNMFAGSVFDLAPATEYEFRLTLQDPDGVSGDSVRTAVVRTRSEPMPAAGGKTYHVYPFGYKGPREEPGFYGLLSAYYIASIGGDWYNAFPPRVRPGDTILVHAGLYKDEKPLNYGHELVSEWSECCNQTWGEPYYLTQSGTEDKPIVIKAAGDGEVIFDGNGSRVLFDVTAANYLYFEGITFRNADIAMLGGRKNIVGSKGLTVKHCRFENVGIGIHSDYSGSSFYYIADNVFIGRHDPEKFIGWSPRKPWGDDPQFQQKSLATSQYAVKIYGQGSVVAFNHVERFHDGIDHATYGDPDNWPNTPRDRMPVAIDFYNNDISNVHDNCIETDGGMYNLRVLRNRCVNAGQQALSMEPSLGGPHYFVRNIVYNVPSGTAFATYDASQGGLVYQNTFLSGINMAPYDDGTASNNHFQNNLIIETGLHDPVLGMDTFDNYSSSNYNGFGYESSSKHPFRWRRPDSGKSLDYQGPRSWRNFGSLREWIKGTGQDRNSVRVDLGVFENLAAPDPSKPGLVYDPNQLNFALRAGSRALDAGTILPNITDDYDGRAPDLGALEFGRPAPHYGPR